MPKIKPFRGIHPSANLAAQVVLKVENLTILSAKAITKANPLSYANMLVPEIDNLYLRGSKKEIAYKKINENFDGFLDKGILIRDSRPALYIYQTEHNESTQTGIWTVTSIDDYLNNTVKKHELTRADREKNLIEYLQQTGIDANPVLITYTADPHINQVIADVKNRQPMLDFEASNARHILWKIDSETEISKLATLFSKLNAAYIADGHHRAAAASTAGIERRKLNLKHRGNEEYNFFSTVYMASDQLKVLEFNRLVKSIGSLARDDFFRKMSENFILDKVGNLPGIPQELHQFGMYFYGCWYMLQPKPHVYNSSNPVSGLDVSILQEFVLNPILGISDPRTNANISFIGGATPVSELAILVDEGEYEIAFVLFPTSIEQLFAVADAGEVMPPKSTWFEPKFQVGMLVHEVG